MHRWNHKGRRQPDWWRHYPDWLHGRRTLAEIGKRVGPSYPTLTKVFDRLEFAEGLQTTAPEAAINLLIDATFFGRAYGYLCFHDTHRAIWFREIKTEGIAALRAGLREVQEAGFKVKSVTIDGRRGYYGTIRKMLGSVPIQMCLYHQQAIVRRYITDRPQSLCGQELRALMKSWRALEAYDFIKALERLHGKHRVFLEERNQQGDFKHQALRAAFKSLWDNLPHLYTWSDFPEANIPRTTSQLEGFYAHLKERIFIHRGVSLHRKKKAIRAFFNSF